MTATLTESTETGALAALVDCLGNGAPSGGTSPAHLLAVLAAEERAASLEILYAGLRDGTFDHTNVPARYGFIAGTGWHDRNSNAAVLVAGALDGARAEVAALRGESA